MFNLRSFVIAMFHSKLIVAVYGQGENSKIFKMAIEICINGVLLLFFDTNTDLYHFKMSKSHRNI